jgi:hypothetical protein
MDAEAAMCLGIRRADRQITKKSAFERLVVDVPARVANWV